jgi:serine/threonine protein kinase
MRLPDMRELEVLGLVGAGACGRVYRARNAAGELVAVKIHVETAVNRLLLEEATLRLEEGGWPAGVVEELSEDYRGKQILRVTRLFEDEQDGVLVPRSLQHRLARFPGEDSWPVVMEILRALAGLHDRQVAHGNLKPGNVFFDDSGRAVLTDWALGNMPGVRRIPAGEGIPEGCFFVRGNFFPGADRCVPAMHGDLRPSRAAAGEDP